ncbi:MAG: carbamoyltransferase HypF [Myxococcota bacterium]
MRSERIRIRGTVQGVGFRPTVAKHARRRELSGFVRNDAEGVLIGVRGEHEELDRFIEELLDGLPPLAKVEAVEREAADDLAFGSGFHIESSAGGEALTDLPADAAACPACLAEVLDPLSRRYRYPFTTCTHCGPRFSIATRIPLDRESTTMADFEMCAECRAEYEDEDDRRYHAQPIACHGCGPKARLERADGRAFSVERFTMMDAVDAVGTLLQRGEIVAVKGLGGWHLCCDATSEEAVAELRRRKRRFGKPLAMMARDLDVIRRFARVRPEEEKALSSSVAPIVILEGFEKGEQVAPSVVPDGGGLGFMLPYTPLHHLILRRVKQPIVCTSGNLSHEPQCIGDQEAKERLSAIADWFLFHDRPIRNRVDDSVVRHAAGELRVVRRARGLSPASTRLPLAVDEGLWAAGADLKSAFCMAQGKRAIVSPHLGDLDEVRTLDAFEQTRSLMSALFEHAPKAVAVDMHPEYRSRQIGRDWAEAEGADVIEVQHHHAHIAAVMAEHDVEAGTEPVLGIALDGLGWGPQGELWGGEFLYCNYVDFRQTGTFKPVPLIGGDVAARQPWRNLYAQLRAEQSWGELDVHFGGLPVLDRLSARRSPMLESAMEKAPRTSSCGRLFDAVAAALDLHAEAISFEGQAAMALEASITSDDLDAALKEERYPIGIPSLDNDLPYLEFLGMWRGILGDLCTGISRSRIAARFHVALSDALVRMTSLLRQREGGVLRRVVLGGGCFQNRILLETTESGLRAAGFDVLSPVRFPAHDGGLALGQAAVASAKLALRRGR